MSARLRTLAPFAADRREPRRTGTLCGASILLVLLLRNWWLVSSRG